MVISITWLVFLRFFSLSSYFSSLSMLYSGRRCHAQPTLMGWEVATYVIWNSFVWEICLFSPICVFIYSIIYFYQYGLMNIYFQVWVLFQCILIFCSNYSSFGHWKFLQLVLLSLSHIQPLCFIFVFLSTFFLVFFLCVCGTRCSKLILYIYCPIPRINHVSKEPCFLLLEPRSGH